MVAIITDVHYRMSLALVRDLGQAGVEVITCETDAHRDNPGSPALGALSRYTARHVWLPENDAISALLALCQEISAQRGVRPAVLPVGAATLAQLAEQRETFTPWAGLCIPTPNQLSLFNDKARTTALAASLGIPVPDSFNPRPGEDLTAFCARLPLPVVVKPLCGEKFGLTAAERYQRADSAETAAAAIRHFRGLTGEAPVVQALLPGSGMGCSVVAWEGVVYAAIAHKRIREYPVTGGPSTCCQVIGAPFLEDCARRMVQAARYTGLAMFEFKEDGEGQPRLLEINPRVWGTFPLTRVSRSGIPLLWYTLAYQAGNPGEPVSLPALSPPRRRKMVFAASDAMAAIAYAHRGQVRKAVGAAMDWLNPAVQGGIFSWRDPLPGVAYTRALFSKERRI